jgi:hypothetical protein
MPGRVTGPAAGRPSPAPRPPAASRTHGHCPATASDGNRSGDDGSWGLRHACGLRRLCSSSRCRRADHCEDAIASPPCMPPAAGRSTGPTAYTHFLGPHRPEPSSGLQGRQGITPTLAGDRSDCATTNQGPLSLSRHRSRGLHPANKLGSLPLPPRALARRPTPRRLAQAWPLSCCSALRRRSSWMARCDEQWTGAHLKPLQLPCQPPPPRRLRRPSEASAAALSHRLTWGEAARLSEELTFSANPGWAFTGEHAAAGDQLRTLPGCCPAASQPVSGAYSRSRVPLSGLLLAQSNSTRPAPPPARQRTPAAHSLSSVPRPRRRCAQPSVDRCESDAKGREGGEAPAAAITAVAAAQGHHRCLKRPVSIAYQGAKSRAHRRYSVQQPVALGTRPRHGWAAG